MRQNQIRPRRADERFVAWRALCLEKAGFARGDAMRLASDSGFDLHAVLELVDRGCPPDLAARILAPLDEAPQ
jgi:hypothetical protein